MAGLKLAAIEGGDSDRIGEQRPERLHQVQRKRRAAGPRDVVGPDGRLQPRGPQGGRAFVREHGNLLPEGKSKYFISRCFKLPVPCFSPGFPNPSGIRTCAIFAWPCPTEAGTKTRTNVERRKSAWGKDIRRAAERISSNYLTTYVNSVEWEKRALPALSQRARGSGKWQVGSTPSPGPSPGWRGGGMRIKDQRSEVGSQRSVISTER